MSMQVPVCLIASLAISILSFEFIAAQTQFPAPDSREPIGKDPSPRPPNSAYQKPPFITSNIVDPVDAEFDIHYELKISADDYSSETLEVFEKRKGSLTRIKLTHGKTQLAYQLWSFSGGKHGQRQTLLEDSLTGSCKLATDVADFFQVGNHFRYFRDAGTQFDSRVDARLSNTLVADLWYLLDKELEKPEYTNGSVQLETTLSRGRSSDPPRLAELPLSNDQVSIVFRFSEDGPKLDSISLASKPVGNQQQPGIKLLVSGISHGFPGESGPMEIRPECQREASEFPELGQLVSNSRILRMKSQETRLIRGGTRLAEYRMHDEWLDLKTKAYRISSRQPAAQNQSSTGQPRDHLFLQETREFFDLSEPNECKSELATKSSPSSNDDDDRDWIVERQLATGLSELSPLLFWLAAEQSGTSRWPALHGPSDQLAVSELLDRDKLTGWLNRRSWMVELDGARSFELQFSKEQHDRLSRQRVALERVLLDAGLNGGRYEFDVVNYEFGLNQITHQFSIPKGHGCKRHGLLARDSVERNRGEDFVPLLDTSKPFEFRYEANLEYLGEQKPDWDLDEVGVLSTAGWFAMCPKGAQPSWAANESSFVFQQESKFYLDGRHEGRRQIYSVRDGFYQGVWRSLNLLTGQCHLERKYIPSPTETFTLDFGTRSAAVRGQTKATIFISHALLNRMSMRNVGDCDRFELIRANEPTESNNWTEERVYELRDGAIWLGPDIIGPGFIVVTLRRWHSRSGDSAKRPPAFTAELILPGQIKLTIRFEHIKQTDCSDLWLKADPEQCYQSDEFAVLDWNKFAVPRLRHFLIEYEPVPQMHRLQVDIDRAQVVSAFLNRLLSGQVGLSPFQVGNVIVLLGEPARWIQIHFNLMEEASAIERFMQFEGHMMDFGAGQERFLGSLESCSRWCDSAPKCLALTYCRNSNRCVISQRASELGKYIKAPECSMYWQPSSNQQPHKSLNDYRMELSRRVENADDDTLSLTIRHQGMQFELRPLSFSETDSDSINVAGSGKKDRRNLPYVIVKQNYALTTGEQKQIDTRIQCLQLCSERGLLLCSHCQDTGTCWLPGPQLDSPFSGETPLWSHYNAALESSEPNRECLVWSQNFEAEFQRFASTRRPSKQLLQVNDVSLAQCAAMCRLHRPADKQQLDCLSFDYCATSSTCYLQSVHVIMDLFDESILATGNGQEESCAHFSRHLEADYRRLADTHFRQHRSAGLGGASFETCALLCRRGESCAAFEFCEQRRQCYIRRQGAESSAPIGLDSSEVEPAIGCSIYVTVHYEAEAQLHFDPGKPPSSIILLHKKWLVLLGSLIGGMLLGLTVQLTHNWVVRRV